MDITPSPLAGWTSHRLAVAAVSMALGSFEEALQMNILKRNHLHVVVMNPHVAFGIRAFRDAVLCEQSVGERSEWEHPYHLYARAKALASWRTGLPSRMIRECMPHLSRNGDTAFWGSAVLDGIIVGVSGVQSFYDEAVAMTVAAWLRALYTGRDKERQEEGNPFIGGRMAGEGEIDY